ncbi:ABC transporter ATP-binding protein [Nocardioides carbamazepini]|uniref:ABC transporter ATP-binding protein n=1 Tax=Nocardioides carbamazepini TaxID=2854259 RepID=UPI00214A48B2|nr:ABC transporter ATP-binding protein [Nocardioides carbamazepini]MCR1781324.1 ABC transporter ATP-binding protein [Nocardioides carbamazepini]
MSEESPALVIDHLDVRYGARRAVDDVSITVRGGELVAVVGESGCGKSSTAMAAVGLLKPAAGSVRVTGTDLVSARGRGRRELLRSIQLICQDPYEALDPRFTVEDVVAEPLLVHRVTTSAAKRRALVVGALERAGVPAAEGYLGRYPHQLSGGQLQRIAIASAIVLEPRVLIADEPVSMLDVSLRAGVLKLFADLRDSGIAILMITHDLVTAAQYADRVVVMYAGRVVEEGRPDVVLSSPRHPYTQALLAAVPDPERSRSSPRPELPGEPPDLAALPPGCRFQPRCPVSLDECALVDPELHAQPSISPTHAIHLVACVRAFPGADDVPTRAPEAAAVQSRGAPSELSSHDGPAS